MHLTDVYSKVDAILKSLDFHALFPGFHRYRYAIYNREEICFDGTIIPYEEDFRGNTSKYYQGEYIAIWNIEQDSTAGIDHLAALLVHEMFHCHQNTLHETRFPSDLLLLSYPNDIDNFTKKYNENRYLADAYEYRDVNAFQKFLAVRQQRIKQYPDMAAQELKAETIEGIAEYVGLKALSLINKQMFLSVTREYLAFLRAENDLLFQIRKISYYTGAIYFLCLDMFGYGICNDMGSDLTAYEQNPITPDLAPPDTPAWDFIEQEYSALVEERETQINQHIANSQYTSCSADICGYDPMNMFRIGSRIYCSHFVCLNENGQIITLHGPIVLELEPHSEANITGYYTNSCFFKGVFP